eukprot:4941419-Alexandrium_andersonii.AAC.1
MAVGDNLGVVRFGAAHARLRRQAMMRPLCDPLGTAAWRGVRLEWQTVRRHLNEEADRLATLAVYRAAAIRDAGRAEPVVLYGPQ